MMIKTNTACILLLSGILFSGGCTSKDSSPKQTKKNMEYQMNWSTFNLKGKIKSIREVNYKQSVPDDALNSYVTKQYFFFDRKGNATRIVTFLEQERFHTDYHYTYDSAGNYISIHSYLEDGREKFRATYDFDDQGRLLDNAEYDPDMSHHVETEYETISSGYIARVQQVVPRSSSDDTYYKYLIDSLTGKSVREVYYDGLDGPVNRTEVSRFDKQGNITETLEYKEKEILTLRNEFKYNENHQCTYRKLESPDPGLNNLEHHWTYDSLGNVTSYKYNSATGISPKSHRTKYTYDNHGNWIRRETETWDGVPRTALERQIEYYD